MLRQNLTLNFSTNKNTTVRINRNFKCCEIFFSDLSRNFNRYFDIEDCQNHFQNLHLSVFGIKVNLNHIIG